MATAVSKVEDLSSNDRTIVVLSLELKLASLVRAGKAASNPAVRDALVAEGKVVSDLIARFR
nr:MAG: hypothetical protein [Microvirus sp.]QJB19681.1 MAG: hypothetical protein [Microvirus sp.]